MKYTLRANPITALAYRKVWDLLHPNTQFVFVATTGRSGTAALQRVFTSAKGCIALHEPYPKMHAGILTSRSVGDGSAAHATYWTRKSTNIRRASSGHDVYVETNHLFIKSFHDYAIADLGSRLHVVHLRRHPVGVARSMARLPAIPGTRTGDLWYFNFNHPGNLISGAAEELGDGGRFSHPFFRSLWYWYEVEARIVMTKGDHPWLDVFCLEWTDRIDPSAVGALLQWAGLAYNQDRITALLQRKTNPKTHRKADWDPDLTTLNDMHQEFRDYLTGLGHDLVSFGVT